MHLPYSHDSERCITCPKSQAQRVGYFAKPNHALGRLLMVCGVSFSLDVLVAATSKEQLLRWLGKSSEGICLVVSRRIKMDIDL